MSQYVDEPYLSGILSGVLLGLAVLWVLVGINHLWKQRLLRYTEGLPFELRAVGVRARLLGEGSWKGQPMKLILLGGPRGERAKVSLGGVEHELSLRDEGLLPQLERLSSASPTDEGDKERPARE